MKVIVAIFNKSTNKYLSPRVTEDTNQAIKEFYMLFNEKTGVTLLTTYPEDYELRELAEFDEEAEKREFLGNPLNTTDLPIIIATGRNARDKWREER